MKVVVLAGGLGTRLGEETHIKPKPLVEIGGMPVLWHIMKIYSTYNINDFIICCGYKGHMIKEYFANYFLSKSDVTFDIKQNKMEINRKFVEPWRVTLVDTGENTMTGGRLKRIKQYLDDESFCVTYGDDLKNVNITDLVDFHKKKGKIATITAVQPPGRFGILSLKGNKVISVSEKPPGDNNWINGGYYIFEPELLDYIKGDSTVLELEPLQKLVKKNEVSAYKFTGKYHPLDTLQDKNHLQQLWNSGKAHWKVW